MAERRHPLPDGPLNRREFLKAAALAPLAAAAPFAAVGTAPLRAAQERDSEKKEEGRDKPAPSPYAPFNMSIQSYSLRNFGFEKMVETLFSLDIRFVELFPGHFPADSGENEMRSRRRVMRHNSVKPISYGVVGFTKDHEKNRALFEFAKTLGLASISADPQPDSFDSLDKLVEEFKIPIAIHNHGPEDRRYRTPEMIEKAIQSHHKLIGLCVDTGHFLRVDVNPVEVVKKFKERVYGVHVKDVKSAAGKKTFTVTGEGDLDTVGLLKGLKESGFKGGLSLEYEEEPDNPVPSIQKCLAAVRDAVKKLA